MNNSTRHVTLTPDQRVLFYPINKALNRIVVGCNLTVTDITWPVLNMHTKRTLLPHVRINSLFELYYKFIFTEKAAKHVDNVWTFNH